MTHIVGIEGPWPENQPTVSGAAVIRDGDRIRNSISGYSMSYEEFGRCVAKGTVTLLRRSIGIDNDGAGLVVHCTRDDDGGVHVEVTKATA